MIKTEDLVQKVRELAENNPTNTYEDRKDFKRWSQGCSYTKGECSNGTVGCIMGQAILVLDPDYKFDDDQESICGIILSDSEITKLEHLRFNPAGVRYLSSRIIKSRDGDKNWLTKVQEGQDDGCTWSTAVFNADVLLADHTDY
jgi:hypothetical protein